MSSEPGVTVVIPAFNEEGGIVAGIEAVRRTLQTTRWKHEIVVVDDGSRDATARLAEQSGVNVLRLGDNQGYGAALKAGIARATYDWVAIIDADGTYPAAELPGMLERMALSDMVVGARTGAEVRDPLSRRPAKWLLRKFASLLAGQSIPDLNSGMRVMRKPIVGEFSALLPSGFSFTTTITLAMISRGYRVTYVPINYYKRVGNSKINPTHALRFAFLIVRTTWRLRGGRNGALRQIKQLNAAVTLPRGDRRKRVIQIAGSLLLLCVLVLIFPRHKLMQALQSIPPWTLAAAVPVFLLFHFMGCLKWHIMVNNAQASLPVLQSMRCYFGGLFANLFLPSVIGGDLVTIALGISRTRKTEGIVSGTMASRVLDLIALALLVGISVLIFPKSVNSANERLMEMVLAVLVAGGLLVCLAVFAVRRKIQGKARAYLDSFVAAWQHPGPAAVALALGFGLQAGLLTLSAWIGAGCGLHLPARAWLFAWPLAKLSGFIPVTLAGIGSRELVLPALLAPFGADGALAASVGLAWDAVLIAGSLVGGAISKIAGSLDRKASLA